MKRGARTRPCSQAQEEAQAHRHNRPEAYPSLAATSTVATRTDFSIGTPSQENRLLGRHTQIPERPLDPRVAQSRFSVAMRTAQLRKPEGQKDDQRLNLGRHGWPAGPAAVAVVFPRDQVSMPGQECLRAPDGSDLAKCLATQVLRLGRQPNALVVSKS